MVSFPAARIGGAAPSISVHPCTKIDYEFLQKLAYVQTTAIGGGAVPKQSGGMEREWNPAKPDFCDCIAKSRPNY